MSITSLTFIAFCFITVLMYYIVPYKFRWIWILIANMIFYLCAGVREVVYILLASFISWMGCKIITKIHAQESSFIKEHKSELSKEERRIIKNKYKVKRKRILIAMIVLILGQLVLLKYNGFILRNVNAVFHTDYFGLNLVIPFGISFYTVFCIGYCVDVYRGQYDAEYNLLKHIAVITFFPCITQGPIERYDHLSEQIFAENKFDIHLIMSGIQLMLWGFFKKLVIADNLSIAANAVFYDDTGTYRGLYIFIAAVLYAIQLYADFSGYTDIVRGLSEMLGISLVENFDSPYLSRDIAEFWRRWHMSLGTWFKDYIFYPALRSNWCMKLGEWSGKRFSRVVSDNLTTTAGLMINWLLIGIWHGPHWKYVAYGLYYGLIMIFSKWMKPIYESIIKTLKINTKCFSYRLFQTLRTFLIVCFGYILFCAETVKDFVRLVKNMVLHINPWILVDGGIFKMGIDQKQAFVLMVSVIILFMVDVLHSRGIEIRKELAGQNTAFRWFLLYSVMFVIMIFGAYGPEYDASNFIYQGF